MTASVKDEQMRIGQSPRADLRITRGILSIDLTWAEWDVLLKDAAHLRATGESRADNPLQPDEFAGGKS